LKLAMFKIYLSAMLLISKPNAKYNYLWAS
jgi:hypothetical protein